MPRRNPYSRVGRYVRGARSALTGLGALASSRSYLSKGFNKGRKYLKKTFGNPKARPSMPRRMGAGALRGSDKVSQDMAGDTQLTKMHVTIGRKVRPFGGRQIRKLVKASTQGTIFRMSAISPFMNTGTAPQYPFVTEVGGGGLWLYNLRNSTNTQYTCPLYLFDITSINQSVNGTVTTYNPCWRLSFDNTTPTKLSWDRPTFQNPNGSTGNSKWEVESSPGATTSFGTYPQRRCLQEYVQARLMCYGAAKQATEFTIEFIQLKEDYLHPDLGEPLTTLTNTGTQYKNSAVGFWESYIKTYVGHPIDTIKPTSRKMYKVLKTIRFTMQPRSSTETDANIGHSKQVNIFFRTNRTLKFDWNEFNLDSLLSNHNTYVYDNGNLSNTVHPKARIYMTVRATNTNLVALPAVPNTDYTPSFDLVLRHKINMVE